MWLSVLLLFFYLFHCLTEKGTLHLKTIGSKNIMFIFACWNIHIVCFVSVYHVGVIFSTIVHG